MINESTYSRRDHLRIITGTVIAGFCCFLQLYAPQPLLALFALEFKASPARVSLVISAATMAVAVASPFVGLLADAVGRKRVILPCLFLLSITTLGCAFAQSLEQLIFWRFLGGICTPGIIAVTIAYISEEARAGTVGSVTSLYVTGTVIGGLVGRLSCAFVADHVSWRWAFANLAIMTLIGAIALWLFLPRSRRFTRQRQYRQALLAIGRHLVNPRLLATFMTGFATLFAHVGMFTYVNFHLSRPPFELTTSQLGLVFLVYALGIVVTPAAGRMIDQFGNFAGLAIAVGMIIGGGLLTLAPNLPLFIVGIAMASSGVFVGSSSASSHIGRVATSARSAATGLYVAFYYLGGSVGATALALPWRLAGWPAVVGTIMFLQVVSLAIAWRFYLPRQRVHAEALPIEG